MVRISPMQWRILLPVTSQMNRVIRSAMFGIGEPNLTGGQDSCLAPGAFRRVELEAPERDRREHRGEGDEHGQGAEHVTDAAAVEDRLR